MSLFQIISLTVLLWLGYKQLRKLKGAPAAKIIYRLQWFFVTLLAVLLVSEPEISSVVAEKMGIGRGVDIAIYFSLIWLLSRSYNQSQEIEGLYSKLDKLVRKISLGGVDEEKTNTSSIQHKK
ncbi:TPA: hypothetical protein DCY43_04230 [candidate division WWE3 bacterium]|uniref:DUF2304 domain-containing protein n=5 Tax=Bacteria candidate phyla TaxID=1783234 RepID=A0A1G2FPG2_9BACT|nr:MAG: hypothetical protein UW65_C0004G0020 [candidate division WWE3 bacterium GW2011_GWB1_44_4]OGC51876.1 MAG: hypothetical protein A2709_00785 [candidate division WWE3 bacterium RIFCSPHIGHO2_01_FULL_43_9]OGZ39498.1 MAG: hypothetical protein A3B04_00465 [Candidatus Portnoybacteria bacterium RIFCSPLOWO2_02_FULL_39_11]HAZ29913.1 hypothetical protein [candidate division WWE3 bacterium]